MSFAAYRGRRVLITGVTGFKGSWLAVWLEQLGAEVFGLSLPPPTSPSLFERAALARGTVSLIEGDIRDTALVRRTFAEARPDFVFHLAAQSLVRPSYEDPVETFSTNVLGTVQILEAVRTAMAPMAVVVVTSDKCYENREQDAGYVEGDALGGHDPYSASKGAAEIVTGSYRRSFFSPARLAEHGVALGSGRAGNVIGPGDWAKDRIVPDAISALSAGRAIPVRNPESVRPWQHVLESLSGYLTLGAALVGKDAKAACEPFNFGPHASDTRPVRELAQRIVAAWGQGSWDDLSDGTAVHEAKLLRLDIEKARRVLGWQPTWTFEQAVTQTVFGYRDLGKATAEEARVIMEHQVAQYESARLSATAGAA